MSKHRTHRPLIKKVVDETIYLTRPRRGAMLREEVWQSSDGQIVKYSLAYINPAVCSSDNGRVLGYDNSHERHHRHFMGTEEPHQFTGYAALTEQFYREVRQLWRNEDEERQQDR